jgi:hypothetical protein
MEGATNQFPRHTRALNQFITMLSSRSSFLLSVGDLSQKKKKIPLAFSLLLLSSSKETKWLSLYGGLDFPVAAFPLSALIKILDVNLANGQSFVCDNRTNNSPAFAETTLIINTVVVVVVEYIL